MVSISIGKLVLLLLSLGNFDFIKCKLVVLSNAKEAPLDPV